MSGKWAINWPEAGYAAEKDQLPATGVFNDSRGILQVARQAGVLDGLHGQLVFLVPLRGPQVQRVQRVGLGALKHVLEKLRKKVMVAVPGATPAHRNDEGMLPLEPLEQVQAIDSLGQAVGEFGVEPLNDRRSPEYSANVVREDPGTPAGQNSRRISPADPDSLLNTSPSEA